MVDFQLLATMLAALVGAFLPFLLWQTLGEDYRRNRLRESSLLDLTSELEQNDEHQQASTYISLEEEAYRRFRRLGFLSELNNDIRPRLRALYSRIHEKNELILYYRSSLPDSALGREPQVSDGQGQNYRRLTEVIAELRGRIEQSIRELLPIFQASDIKADLRSARLKKWIRWCENSCKILALIFLLAATYYATQIIQPISSQFTTSVETTTVSTITPTTSTGISLPCTTFANGTKHCIEILSQTISINQYITGYVSHVLPTQEMLESQRLQYDFDLLAFAFFGISLLISLSERGMIRHRRMAVHRSIFKE